MAKTPPCSKCSKKGAQLARYASMPWSSFGGGTSNIRRFVAWSATMVSMSWCCTAFAHRSMSTRMCASASRSSFAIEFSSYSVVARDARKSTRTGPSSEMPCARDARVHRFAAAERPPRADALSEQRTLIVARLERERSGRVAALRAGARRSWVVGVVRVGVAKSPRRCLLAVFVVSVAPHVGRGLRVSFRRVLPLLLTPERGHVEVAPGAPQRLIATTVDEVGAAHAVAVTNERIRAVPLTIDDDEAFATLRDVGRLFPDISERVPGFPADRALTPVNRFTAREVVIVGGRLRIGKTPGWTPSARSSCGTTMTPATTGRSPSS